jgi:hypothetical protein
VSDATPVRVADVAHESTASLHGREVIWMAAKKKAAKKKGTKKKAAKKKK